MGELRDAAKAVVSHARGPSFRAGRPLLLVPQSLMVRLREAIEAEEQAESPSHDEGGP